MENQPWSLLPKTSLGKWSVVLIIIMPLWFIVGSSLTNLLYESVPAGDTILEDIRIRPALAFSMLAGMVSGIFAFVTGLLAIASKKEKAISVNISSVFGALLILFLIAEILFPH